MFLVGVLLFKLYLILCEYYFIILFLGLGLWITDAHQKHVKVERVIECLLLWFLP